MRLAESFRAENLGHGRLFLQGGDSANFVIDLSFPQFIGGKSRRVSMAGIVPHTVGPSGERLDPALDEGVDKLEARQFFLRRGPELLDLLHQRLRDLHLFFGQLMRPQRPRPKDVGRAKFIEHESLAGGWLLLGVEPLRPPAGIVFGV
jgi:hypothetical protein